MALIVGGTTVTGTQTLEASTLTGTASAINGSNITNLPAPSSANVASATAGVSLGAVGTYALADNLGNSFSPNDTKAGSGLRMCTVNGAISHSYGALSGTWRAMGNGSSTPNASVFLRIS